MGVKEAGIATGQGQDGNRLRGVKGSIPRRTVLGRPFHLREPDELSAVRCLAVDEFSVILGTNLLSVQAKALGNPAAPDPGYFRPVVCEVVFSLPVLVLVIRERLLYGECVGDGEDRDLASKARV
jgi:hypothetical protein